MLPTSDDVATFILVPVPHVQEKVGTRGGGGGGGRGRGVHWGETTLPGYVHLTYTRHNTVHSEERTKIRR